MESGDEIMEVFFGPEPKDRNILDCYDIYGNYYTNKNGIEGIQPCRKTSPQFLFQSVEKRLQK